jgi:hypothetical protein
MPVNISIHGTSKVLPCVAIEFAAFINAEDEEHVFAGTVCLVENAFIMHLRRPKPCLDTKIEIILRARNE